jgi:predicted esterase YcpF (UPF0227 family)
MADLSSALITTLTGMVGVIIGATINNYFNHKIARQSAKKDIIFKKEIEYFERIVDTIEKNIELYKRSIKRLEKNYTKKDVSRVFEELKKDRKKFEIMTSPLYLDIRQISSRIRNFVAIEKLIFAYLDKMRDSNYSKSELSIALNLNLIELQKVGNSIILLLREHLIRE